MTNLLAQDSVALAPVPVLPLGPAPQHPPAMRLPNEQVIKAEIAHVLHKQLSSDLLRWVDGYAQVGKRSPYLWKWARQGVEVTALSCVDPALFDFACDTKVLGVVLAVLLDDIADRKGDAIL